MILAAAWYHTILAFLFTVLAVLIMLVILLQRGRGVGLSGAFGGAGGGTSAFGAKTGDILTWVTIVGAAAMLTFTAALNYVFVETPEPALTAPAPGPEAPGVPGPAPGAPGVPQQPVSAVPMSVPPPTPMPMPGQGPAPATPAGQTPAPIPAAPQPQPQPQPQPEPTEAPPPSEPPAPSGGWHQLDPALQPVYAGLAIFGVGEA